MVFLDHRSGCFALPRQHKLLPLKISHYLIRFHTRFFRRHLGHSSHYTWTSWPSVLHKCPHQRKVVDSRAVTKTLQLEGCQQALEEHCFLNNHLLQLHQQSRDHQVWVKWWPSVTSYAELTPMVSGIVQGSSSREEWKLGNWGVPSRSFSKRNAMQSRWMRKRLSTL